MERHDNRSSTYRFTLPVVAGVPVDPDGLIPMYRDFAKKNKLRLRVRGRLGRNNPFTKMIDFRGARDIDLMYATRCDVYLEVRA